MCAAAFALSAVEARSARPRNPQYKATAAHPVHPQLRAKGYQYNKAIHIGENCWFGAGVLVMPGVTVGDLRRLLFLVAMPLCMGIAVASGVPAERGLITGIINLLKRPDIAGQLAVDYPNVLGLLAIFGSAVSS